MDTTGDTFGHFPRLFGDRPALCEQRDTDSVRVRAQWKGRAVETPVQKKVEGGANRETAKFGLKFASHLMRPDEGTYLIGYAMALLQNINSLEIGESAEGHMNFNGDEPFFADHFPGFPVVPGVLQIEALAQISGKLIEVSIFDRYKRWTWPILSMVRKSKFRRFVKPGQRLQLNTQLKTLGDESALVRYASVAGKKPVMLN